MTGKLCVSCPQKNGAKTLLFGAAFILTCCTTLCFYFEMVGMNKTKGCRVQMKKSVASCVLGRFGKVSSYLLTCFLAQKLNVKRTWCGFFVVRCRKPTLQRFLLFHRKIKLSQLFTVLTGLIVLLQRESLRIGSCGLEFVSWQTQQ